MDSVSLCVFQSRERQRWWGSIWQAVSDAQRRPWASPGGSHFSEPASKEGSAGAPSRAKSLVHFSRCSWRTWQQLLQRASSALVSEAGACCQQEPLGRNLSPSPPTTGCCTDVRGSLPVSGAYPCLCFSTGASKGWTWLCEPDPRRSCVVKAGCLPLRRWDLEVASPYGDEALAVLLWVSGGSIAGCGLPCEALECSVFSIGC